MRHTCEHTYRMPIMVQIRNVPDELHRRLKVRAAQAGTTLSQYLLREVSEIADRPTTAEVLQRIRSRPALKHRIDSAAAVRAERGSRR